MLTHSSLVVMDRPIRYRKILPFIRKAVRHQCRQCGFSLIEVAIVVVILGLLTGTFLVGQDLIFNAKTRHLIERLDKVRVAYFGFVDRFRALPGDYRQAYDNIRGLSSTCASTAGAGNGNGNGIIEFIGQPHENLLAWEHLSKAGFLEGAYTCATTAGAMTSPSNLHGSLMSLQFDAAYRGSNGSGRHNLKTGRELSSAMLAAIDRAVDDGIPNTGNFRAPDVTNPECFSAGAWATNGTNCEGISLL